MLTFTAKIPPHCTLYVIYIYISTLPLSISLASNKHFLRRSVYSLLTTYTTRPLYTGHLYIEVIHSNQRHACYTPEVYNGSISCARHLILFHLFFTRYTKLYRSPLVRDRHYSPQRENVCVCNVENKSV